jgi:nucleoside-diphosphate-sugar epimerase
MGFRRFLAAAMRDEPLPLFGDGRQTRDFTFVNDTVSATVAAATHGTPGAVYNIGGGSRVGILEVFELIAQITGRPMKIERFAPQRGDMRDTYADTRRACTDLGFTPTVTLEQGLRAQYEWMAQAGA